MNHCILPVLLELAISLMRMTKMQVFSSLEAESKQTFNLAMSGLVLLILV